MERKQYEEVLPKERSVVLVELNSGDVDKMVRALLSLAFYDEDRQWVQNKCIEFSIHNHFNVRGIAILCFGHLARIHRELDIDSVMPIVIKAFYDPDEFVRGNADSALSDILLFCIPDKDKYNRDVAIDNLYSNKVTRVLLGLSAITKCDSDWQFAQEKCIELSEHTNEFIRGKALMGFATIASENESLDLNRVLPIVSKANQDVSLFVRECASSTKDCIETFLDLNLDNYER
jgi:hypothetical protein